MAEERDLKKELDALNIISFDCNNIATKEDVFTALDAISDSLKGESEDDVLKHIENLKRERLERQFAQG